MAEKFEYIDHLQEYMKGRVKNFVEGMGNNTPTELREMSKDKLLYNLTDFATPILRGMESDAILSACYKLTTGIRWAKQNPDSGTYGRKK